MKAWKFFLPGCLCLMLGIVLSMVTASVFAPWLLLGSIALNVIGLNIWLAGRKKS